MLIPPCLPSFPERKVGSTCFNSFHGWSIGKKTEMKLKKKKKAKEDRFLHFLKNKGHPLSL